MESHAPELLKCIAQLTAENRSWMSDCKEICRVRLPKVIFEAIPPTVWKYVPWGHRMTVLRTPMTTRLGKIIIPDTAKRENSVGWVLSVGRAICEPDPKLPDVAPLRGLTTWDEQVPWQGPATDCLTLVGECVLFSQWAGKPLRQSAFDDTMHQLDGNSPFLVLSVGDISGPYLDLPDDD